MRTIAAAVLLILSLDIAAQTTRTRQIVLRCVNSSRLSVAGETIIYKDCDDGKTYLSKDGAAFAEVTTASPSVQPKNGARSFQPTGGEQTISATTWTPLEFTSEASPRGWDFGGYHSTVTNTSRFTVPGGKAGLHVFNCGVSTSVSTGTFIYARIVKNGTDVMGQDNFGAARATSGSGGGMDVLFTMTLIDDLAVGDYLTLELYSSSGSATMTADSTYCSMVLIGQ